MKKSEIIVKEEIDWSYILNPFIWFTSCITNLFIGLFLIITSFIPIINLKITDRIIEENNFVKNVKYKIKRKGKEIHLERV